MPDFAKVLAAAILLFAGLLIITQSELIPSGKSSNTTKYVKYEEEKILLPAEKEIGEGVVVKHVVLGRHIIVSFIAGEKILLSAKNITVKNGLFERKFWEASFSLPSLETLEKSEIELRIIDTNLYAPLVIELNGKIIYSNYTLKGEKEIPLNVSILKRKNEIRIYPISSGWRLWAPTTYILDIKITGKFLELKHREFAFLVENASSLDMLRVIWYVEKRQGEGNLIAKINGVEIYRGKETAPFVDVNPKRVKIRNGENYLELFAERNTSIELSDLELIFFYRIFKKPTFKFNITRKEYLELATKNATLSFTISRLEGDIMALSIKIKNSKGVRTILLQGILQEGKKYEITLTQDYLAEGENVIEFTTSGKGIISVKDVELKV